LVKNQNNLSFNIKNIFILRICDKKMINLILEMSKVCYDILNK